MARNTQGPRASKDAPTAADAASWRMFRDAALPRGLPSIRAVDGVVSTPALELQ
jgi:hypothetical protein